MFHGSQTGTYLMDVVSFVGSVAHHLSSFQLDDSSMALIALLVGMVGGYRLTGVYDQMKEKRAKVARRPQDLGGKSD